MGRSLIALALCAMLACARPANATILLFANLGLSNYNPIPGSYGDFVTNKQGGKYAKGGGWTPNVKTSYATVNNATNVVYSTRILYWDSGYGDLVDVGFSELSHDNYGEVALKGTNGYKVKLLGFDLAGYNQVDHLNQPVRLVDKNNAIYENFGPVTISGAGPTHSHFTPTLGPQKLIRIQWGDNWNTGIDNISFTQVAPKLSAPQGVPEPGAWALLAGAVLPVAWCVRKRLRS